MMSGHFSFKIEWLVLIDTLTERYVVWVYRIENRNVKYVHADEGEGEDADIDID